MAKYKVGFIGCGNMGGALAKAVSRELDEGKLALCDKNTEHASRLAKKLNAVSVDIDELIADSEWIIIAVKPQNYPELFEYISIGLKNRKDRFKLVSIAAGIEMETVKTLADLDCPVIRIMPNTPVAVEQGMVLYTGNEFITEEDLEEFRELMKHAGRMEALDETLIDAGCSVSGCGPAFVFMFIDALAKGGESCGLSYDEAMIYAAQTLIGSSALLLESGKSAEELKQAVCSPGGSTIEGVKALEDRQFTETIMSAVKASYEKNKMLGKS